MSNLKMDKAPKPSQRASLVAHCFNYTLSPFHLLWSTISTIYPVKYKDSKWHCIWKLQKKVSFSSASEASYVYNLRGQTFIQFVKNDIIWRILKTWSLWSNSVTRQVTIFIGQKLVENAKIEKSLNVTKGWNELNWLTNFSWQKILILCGCQISKTYWETQVYMIRNA